MDIPMISFSTAMNLDWCKNSYLAGQWQGCLISPVNGRRHRNRWLFCFVPIRQAQSDYPWWFSGNQTTHIVSKGSMSHHCQLNTATSNDDCKQQEVNTPIATSTVLSWMNGIFSWFEQMAHLRVYVLTQYHSEQGDCAMDEFVMKSPDKKWNCNIWN